MNADFEKLYNTYYMKVYSYIMTLVKNRHNAEEITQNTFFKAMTTFKKRQGTSSEFTWLCAIAKNLFIDEARKNKRISESEIEPETASDVNIEKSFENEETTFRIHQILHNLDEPYKEVFQLRIFGELSFQKIGLLFGKTENWARVTYHRARIKINERLD